MSMTYNAIYRGRNKLRNKSIHGRNRSSSNSKSCIVEKCTAKDVLPMGKSVKKCGRDNHFKSVCRSNDKHDSSRSRPKKGQKGKRVHEINEKNDSMDDLADQEQSLLYHDVHNCNKYEICTLKLNARLQEE